MSRTISNLALTSWAMSRTPGLAGELDENGGVDGVHHHALSFGAAHHNVAGKEHRDGSVDIDGLWRMLDCRRRESGMTDAPPNRFDMTRIRVNTGLAYPFAFP